MKGLEIMQIRNIIIQAGGRGTRLEKYTSNKPKCLVPVNNLPILFYAFQKFPNATFHIICDYKNDVLEKYLSIFANQYHYCLVKTNQKGTCSGVSQAIHSIGMEEPFIFMWSDLILSNDFSLSQINAEENYIGISKDFECRWSYHNHHFVEQPSKKEGVAGFFIFQRGSIIEDVPEQGGFVEYLSKKPIGFRQIGLYGTKEIGTILSYNEYNDNTNKCRPFNKMTFDKDIVTKIPVTQQGIEIAKNEIAWYKKAKELNFRKIPLIYEIEPLKMNRIKGKNIFEYPDLSIEQKRIILKKMVNTIKELHTLVKPINAVSNDVIEIYFNKTFNRINKVKDLIPFGNEEYIQINGKTCKNIFYLQEVISNFIQEFMPQKFHFIHGDCTFSNIMFDSFNEEIVLIDPRGYFGKTRYYGDEYYDWAKLYYSLIGNYDQFNRKNFTLNINSKNISIKIGSNNWEDMKDYFFTLLPDLDQKKLSLIHALIWLSLTTYAWEDYDSICGAFYNGLLYLNEVLE